MPIARYTQRLMDDLLRYGKASERVVVQGGREHYTAAVARARSRLHNAAIRVGVDITTEVVRDAKGARVVARVHP